MNQSMNLNQGIYFVQSGHRNDIAIIDCPYISHKIEVYDAHGLKILHGAQVFWTEVRRHYLSKRKGNREVISAVVVGIKHCQYLCEGKKFLCTLKIQALSNGWKIQGVPIDKKLPTFDVINSPQIQSLDFSSQKTLKKFQQRYLWGQFICWNYQDALPKGCITGTFSRDYKTPQVQGQVLLNYFQISQKKSTLLYPKYLLKKEEYLPIKNHQQFNKMVFTVDPQNSIDIEDGLSLQQISQGLYELGVHISDVTSYSHLINRQEIVNKGTSIYLPHKTLHMMPLQMIDILALKSKRRRLAFSVFFTVNDQGQIIQTRFQKTVVKSVAQLSYQEAQDIIDDQVDQNLFMQQKKLNAVEMEQMKSKLKIMKKLAKNRRQARSNFNLFDKDEVVFQLDKNGLPINIGLKKRIQSQKIVQEFMIMSNYEVAKKLVKDFGANSLIIYHPKPLDCNIEHLNGYVSDLGVKFKADNMMHLQNEFKMLFQKEALNDSLKQLLLYKAIHIQEYAVYTRYLNTYKGHFGLNLDFYTHFTSPLRRFADQIVHEQLQMCINNKKLKINQIAKLEEQIQLVNKSRTKNKKLKHAVVQCFMNLYLYHRREKINTKGFIIRLGLRSSTIYVPQYNLIKEINWNGNTSHADKDKIEVVMGRGEQKIVRQFQKNDQLNIEIEFERHQEIQVKIVLQHNRNLIKI